jgi:hypothetical protein
MEKKVKNLTAKTNDLKRHELCNSVINIIEEVANGFKTKTYRNITYSEMSG